jgi:hypothetical protein
MSERSAEERLLWAIFGRPTCDLTLSPAGRWVCLAHDVEAEPRLPDAYVSNPGPEDFKCPIGEDA